MVLGIQVRKIEILHQFCGGVFDESCIRNL